MKCFINFLCCLVLLFVFGCQSQSGNSEPLPERFAGQFPDYLVGVWKADEFKWGFKLEADGSISKFEHIFAGQINLKEGTRELKGPDEGTYAAFVAGPCEASYDATGRKLSVKIVLDYYIMQLPQGALEGNSKDYFDGVISDENETWSVDWRSYTWLEGADPPDAELIENNPEKLTFRKIKFDQNK